MTDVIDEIEEVDTLSVAKDSYAAVPIHFRPGAGKEKLIKLVIPNIEPPLAYFRISGETKDSIEIETIDEIENEDVDDTTPEGEVLVDEEASVDAVKDDEPTEEGEDETIIENDEPVEEDETAVPEEEELEGEIDYPYEDEAGNPVAGFLIDDSEDAELPVVVVKPQEGETAEDAVKRVSKDHENHRVATLDQAIAILGHNPLTSEDN
jgi:hypothetical protein